MKKTYISPEVEVVDIHMTAPLLAGSDISLAIDTETSIDPSGADAPGLSLGLPPSIASLIGM